jgi:hypothetical protein
VAAARPCLTCATVSIPMAQCYNEEQYALAVSVDQIWYDGWNIQALAEGLYCTPLTRPGAID